MFDASRRAARRSACRPAEAVERGQLVPPCICVVSDRTHRAELPGASVAVGNELAAEVNGAGNLCVFSTTTTHTTADIVDHVPVSWLASVEACGVPGKRC